MNTVIYGSETEGLRLSFSVNQDGKFLEITDVTLLAFGKEQPIINLVDSMKIELRDYIIKYLDRMAKYRRLENQFKERLRDTVIIDNEPIYIECLREFESRTKGDDYMEDLNN